MVRKAVRWPPGAVVGFLLSIGIAAFATTHYLCKPYNPGFFTFPTIVALHVVLGSVYLLFTPFQFAKWIRSKHLGYYPWAGRVALHREWMIRAFAIALTIATQRLIFVRSLFVAGVADPTDGRIVTLSLAAWSAALIVHSSLAEVWIHLTQKRGVPTASRAETASKAIPGNR